MEHQASRVVSPGMKRDGRTLGYDILEEMRKVAVQRINAGEHPAEVAASFGFHRSWGYKSRATARGRSNGLRSLHPNRTIRKVECRRWSF